MLDMKKVILMMLFAVLGFTTAMAQQNQAEIKFESLSHNFGTFSTSVPIHKTTFRFTNVGNAPLIINQAVASCGCTIPKYDKRPIAPGQKGTIEVIYNGKDRFPGKFRKSITVRTNGKTEMTRLYIEGVMND